MPLGEVKEEFYFLKAGGEMGKLTRQYPWEQSILGSPDQWPAGLRATLAIVLQSKFPMFLFWGPQHTSFYNDAYRVSLGNEGKHPSALGKPGIEVFPEIWNDIKPLIDDVHAGADAIMNEDLLLPIYRNQQLEDVYWTFCYSAAFNDDGSVGGVLVVCQETTEKVRNLKLLEESNSQLRRAVSTAVSAKKIMEESEERFHNMADATDILIAIGDETNKAVYYNKAWIQLTGRQMEKLIEHGWLDLVHPEDRDRHAGIYRAAFDQLMPFTSEFRIKNKEGDYRWLLATANPRFRSDKSFAGYISNCIDITESKINEAQVIAANKELIKVRDHLEFLVGKVSHSEQRFRGLIEAAPVAIALFNGRDLVIEEPNQAFIEMTGKDASIIGKPLREAMPELDGQPFLQILDDVYCSGKGFATTGTQVKVINQGTITNNFYDFTYTPLFNDKREVYAILEIAIDVTHKIIPQRIIEKSEQNLRNIILQAPVAMCILWGPEHTVQIANERMFGLWGKTSENVMNKPIFEGLPEATGQGIEELMEKVYTTGIPYHGYEVPVTLPRGGRIEIAFLNFVYEALKEPDGSISGVMVVANDVTEQVLARKTIERNSKELQNSTDRLQLAIEAGELGLYEIDLSTNIIHASDRFNEIFNRPNAASWEQYLQVIHPDDLELRNKAMQQSMQTGMLEYIARLVVSHQHVRWILVKGKVVFDKNKRPERLLGIVQDITDLKELEAQKDSFLGIASHELKTPITSIKAYAQMMLMMMEKAGQTTYADMMRRIDKQVNSLNYLITDLLDVTKINSGRLKMNLTSFDFRQLVEEVAEDIQRISPAHTLHREYQINGNVTADRHRLSQVITNLLSNAIKYSPGADRINVYTKQEDNYITLCVEDFGIGIPEDKQERVFEQFYRVSGTREHTFPGLGLGLYISSEIVNRMGGRIWVNSIEGKGSTFCFSFPLEKHEDE